MKQPIDLARRFLALADQDIKTFEVLIESDEIADSQIWISCPTGGREMLEGYSYFKRS